MFWPKSVPWGPFKTSTRSMSKTTPVVKALKGMGISSILILTAPLDASAVSWKPTPLIV